MKAIITMNIGILSIYAVDATNPPSAREPVSPMNTFAGYTLYTRKPRRHPTAAQATGATPESVPTATTAKNVAMRTVTDDASPSSPSVKFAPLTVPSTMKNNSIT